MPPKKSKQQLHPKKSKQQLHLQKANLISCFNRTSEKELKYPIFENEEKREAARDEFFDLLEAATTADDIASLRNSYNEFKQMVDQAEHFAKSGIETIHPTPLHEGYEEGGPSGTIAERMNIIPTDYDNDYVKQLIRKNPKLKKEITKILSKMLLKGEIDEGTFEDIVGKDTQPFTERIEKSIEEKPELKGQLVKMAQEDYLKGNIDKAEYEKLKSMAYEKQTATPSTSVTFRTPINYKTKQR